MKKALLIIVIFSFCISCKKDNPTDPNNNNNGTVTIGTQVWMSKNLDVTTYRNGDAIPEVTDATTWANLTTGAWCYYKNDSASGAIYGKLYNWYAVNDPRGLAPVGWHVPSDSEWVALTTFLGLENVAGGVLKSEGTREDGNGFWYSPNTGATNAFGFNAHPGGLRSGNGAFGNVGNNCDCWSTTELNTENAWYRSLEYNFSGLYRYNSDKKFGFSVRCIKDN